MEHKKLVKEMEKHEAELMKTISSDEKSNVEFKKEVSFCKKKGHNLIMAAFVWTSCKMFATASENYNVKIACDLRNIEEAELAVEYLSYFGIKRFLADHSKDLRQITKDTWKKNLYSLKAKEKAMNENQNKNGIKSKWEKNKTLFKQNI